MLIKFWAICSYGPMMGTKCHGMRKCAAWPGLKHGTLGIPSAALPTELFGRLHIFPVNSEQFLTVTYNINNALLIYNFNILTDDWKFQVWYGFDMEVFDSKNEDEARWGTLWIWYGIFTLGKLKWG
jgi:hypothetical protein